VSKILYIKANPKANHESNTFQLANVFLEEYKLINPDDEITVLDLYKEQIKFLDHEMITKMVKGLENEMEKHARLFASFDKYIIAAPMWNLSIPAILKAYFDYITYVGITFKYTEQGPVGLLSDQDRKLLHVVTRGGQYSEGHAKDFELGDRYIRTLSAFVGIKAVKTLKIELTNVLLNEQLEEVKQQAYQEAVELAKIF